AGFVGFDFKAGAAAGIGLKALWAFCISASWASTGMQIRIGRNARILTWYRPRSPCLLSRYLVIGRMQDYLQTEVLPEPPEELIGTFLRRLGEGVGKVVYASPHWVVKRERSPSEVVAIVV